MPHESLKFERKPQPALNVPWVILILLMLIVAIHLYRVFFLDADAIRAFIVSYAFIPARFGGTELAGFDDMTKWWTLLSYSLLHADISHVLVNLVWMLAFGSVVACRFKTFAFLSFCAVASLAGAGAHYFSAPQSYAPMIGASAVVSGCMGASLRFAFPENGRFSPAVYNLPAQSLSASLRNSQAMTFLVVWLGINVIFGTGGELFAGNGQSIAWQAHMGGFFTGFLGFSMFDRDTHS